MTRVAVATTSQIAADAAAEVCEAGGNAVDCAVAAALLTMNSEPGVCALGGSAFVTVWPHRATPVTIDGNVAIPGIGLESRDVSSAVENIYMEYGGGVETLIGAATVAVPGSLAALEQAVRKFGATDWRVVVKPSVDATRSGFPLSAACHHYLEYSAEPIFSRSDDGYSALHDAEGQLLPPGAKIIIPHLADSLEAIGREGADIFYRGDIARAICDHIQDLGGCLTMEDMCQFQPLIRQAIQVRMNDWTIATNPPPAIGGAVLSAMLLAFNGMNLDRWDEHALSFLIEVQRAALACRTDVLEVSEDIARDVDKLLESAAHGNLVSRYASASTVHTSAVDDTGLACSVTASSGYGSGEMPAGTGIWLNNCIGELELNPRGTSAGPPGERLPSNMAPTVARNGDAVLAVGSPGADRITTALQQFLINYAKFGMSLQQAVEHPRLHLDIRGAEPVLACEPGIELPAIDMAVRRFDRRGMYFGGVGVAKYDPENGFEVSADPRREGGTFTA